MSINLYIRHASTFEGDKGTYLALRFLVLDAEHQGQEIKDDILIASTNRQTQYQGRKRALNLLKSIGDMRPHFQHGSGTMVDTEAIRDRVVSAAFTKTLQNKYRIDYYQHCRSVRGETELSNAVKAINRLREQREAIETAIAKHEKMIKDFGLKLQREGCNNA